MAAKKHPIFDTATTLGKLVAFLGISTICGVLVAGLMVPAVALAGGTATSSITFFDDLPDEMKFETPALSSKILAADGSVIATFYDQNRTEVPLDSISPFIQDAIVAVEDARFREHGGIDTRGLMRAVAAMVQGGGRQGASTITQQYVSNVMNQTHAANGELEKVKQGDSKGIGDKVREIKLAIAVDKQLSKDEILQGYLNWVFFANNNYGVEAASSFYFSAHAKDLTLPQAALLAGVVNRPSYYDPVVNPDNALSRRNMVLDRMLDQGMIDAAQHAEATKAEIGLKVQENRNGCTTAARAEYFCQYVTNLLLNDVNYGKTPEDRDRLLKQGGLTITTTLDPVLQDAAQAQINNFTPMDNNPDRVGQAISTIQPASGKILAMAQNTKLSAPEGQWANNYNFNVDMFDAAGNELGGAGGFATGSTMKPFTFAEWLNSGHRINEIVDASVRKYPLSYPWTNTCGTTTSDYDSNSGNGSQDLRNAENNFYQRLTAREGLYNSLNTATFAMASQLDFCNIQKMMTATGIHDGRDPNKQYDMSFARNLIGNDSVAPMTMAAAFATFAANGTHCDPIALISVTNVKGEALPVPGANCKETVKPEVAAGVTSVLQDVLVRGSGYQIPLQYAAGAKTGTTNDSEQTWTVGFTKGLATASWVGNPDLGSRSSNGLLIANQRIPYVDGATYAGKAWQGYMNQVAGNYDVSFFDAPPANMVNPPVVIAPKPAQPAKPAEKKDDSVKTDDKKKD